MIRWIGRKEYVRQRNGRLVPADMGVRVSNGIRRRMRRTGPWQGRPRSWDVTLAMQLRAQGLSYQQIAKRLRKGTTTIFVALAHLEKVG